MEENKDQNPIIEGLLDPMEVDTFKKLDEEFRKVLLIKDKGILNIVCGAVVANRLPANDPLWLFIIAPSSGGKTEFINALDGLDFVIGIDTLTVNTFASGQQRTGQETSLLHKLPGNEGIFTFKDFTTILDMNPLARREIMGQLRAIFDNKFEKKTGNGQDITWKGKVGMIAAVTSIIHDMQSEFSSMGERFIQYEITQPDRRKVQRKVLENKKRGGMGLLREHLNACFKNYMEHILPVIEDEDITMELTDETQEEIFEVADLTTLARSAVQRDVKDRIRFIPDPEMPTRVTAQLTTLALGFVAMRKAERKANDPMYGMKGSNNGQGDNLTDEERDLLYKVALDSIPRKRRQVLIGLTKYGLGVTSAGIATMLGYPNDTIKMVLQELNALGFCERKKSGGTYKWHINEAWGKTLQKFEHIDVLEEELVSEDGEEDYADIINEMDEAFGFDGN